MVFSANVNRLCKQITCAKISCSNLNVHKTYKSFMIGRFKLVILSDEVTPKRAETYASNINFNVFRGKNLLNKKILI